MTLSTTAIAVAFQGNGSTTAFPVPFAFFGTGSSAELEVIERVIATGAETVKTVTTHYTVSGGNGSTGTVTALVAPAGTVEWHIRRKTTKTQTTDYVPNDPFPAASHEAALDRIVAQVQEVADDLANRAPLLDKTEDQGPIRIIVPSSTGQAMTWVGSGLDTLAPSDLPLQDYVDSASLYASEAGEYADEAGSEAAAAAASAASASGHSSLAGGYADEAGEFADAAQGYHSLIVAASVPDKISAFEVVRNNASATEVLMANDVSAFGVVAAAISADQVLVANDKSAVGVFVNTASGYASLAGSHVNTASGYASLSGAAVDDASGHASIAGGYANDASGHASVAASEASDAAGSASLAGSEATAAAASATQAANAVGGLTFIFDDATSAADPGAGEFRLNNATPGSATALYIDNADDAGGSVTGWLDAWATSTNTQKGIVLLKGLDEPAAFLMAYVTAVVDSTGYRTVTITVLASGGSFILGDRFLVTFAPAGNKGADGAGSGDVLGAGSGSTGKFAMWVNTDTLTVADISAEDVVNFGSAADSIASAAVAQGFSSREAVKGDVHGMTGTDYLSPRAVQSANDWVTVTPRSGAATMDLSTGRNFRWFPNANVTLSAVGEKVGMMGLIEILRSGSESVTWRTEFDAANVALSGADYVVGYHVLSAGDILVLPGGPHV